MLSIARILLPLILITALLSACGGGAGGSAANAPTSVPPPPLSTDQQRGLTAAGAATAAPAATSAPAATTAPEATAAPATAAEAPPVQALAPQSPGAKNEAVQPTQPPAGNPNSPPIDIAWTAADHLSTFAMDVDTASYKASKRYIQNGQLPPADMVRTEEFVNAFDYGYENPEDTFGITIDAAPLPYGRADARLVRVGIQGHAIPENERQPATLTFVIDVSGSMQQIDRLALVQQTLRMLIEKLRNDDKVGIVVYGSEARVLVEPIGINEQNGRERLLQAINSLGDEGSTNAEAGLRLGYQQASTAFRANTINRVILCSDGVANVGQTGPEAILQEIRGYAADGIYLTTVGFGMGDYNDHLMEQLANDGNGNYAYVSDLDEAWRVFGQNLTGTLQVIAKDAKIQVSFNPAVVTAYRLLGYENRAIADQDFRNDRVDAGEVGAGHSVTALYEVLVNQPGIEDVLTVRIRYANPDTAEVRELSKTLPQSGLYANFLDTPPNMRLAATAAYFAETLKQNPQSENRSWGELRRIAEDAARSLPNHAGARELQQLIEQASQLRGW